MAGFMSGFGTTLAQLIEEDRKYYRDAAAKRRDYIQTYGTRAVTEREDKANAALGVANTLMDRGFSRDYVTSIAANNGVRSMVEFADQISKRTDLTEKDIKEIEASAKDFVKDNPDEDLTSVVKRAYGLYKSTKDPVARKRNIFGAMLGLDASMMEDDVLNDMYIDGYTGSDIYRIMGSAGPGAGKPLGVKLPPKPFTFKQNNDFINVKMVPSLESSIAQERAYIKQVQGTSPGEEVTTTLMTVKGKLDSIDELIKNNKYSEAMQTYLETANIQYGSSFVGALQQFDEFYPGAVSRNPLLTDSFKTTYLTQIGDIKDDAAAADTTGTQEPKGDRKAAEPPKTDIFTYETAEELNAAVESGKVVPGVTPVRKGQDGPIMMVPVPSPSVTFDLSLDGLKGDRSSREDVLPSFSSNVTPETVAKVEQAFDPVVADEKELTVEDQAEQRYDAVQSTIDDTKQALGEAVIGTAEVLDDINAIGDRAAVKAKWAVGTRIATGMGAIAQYLGYEDLAKGWYQWSIKNQDRGSSSPLLTQQINDMLDALGVPDFSEGVNIPEKDKTAQELVTEIFDDVASMTDEEKAAKVEELKAVAAKYKESKGGTSIASAMLYGKAQDTESGAGTFTGEPTIGEAPDIQTKTRSGTLGDTRTDSDPTLPASMTVEQMTTRGKKARPSGLMSPPSSGTAPKLGQAEFGDLIDRVHGSSKAAEVFNNKVSSGKVTAADVTRLIKATRKLPNTKSKDTLLQSLFDLRDALNKR